MVEQDYNNIIKKTLDEFIKIIYKPEPEVIADKYIPPTYRGFLNSLRACHPEAGDLHHICLLEKQKGSEYNSILINGKSQIIRISKCNYIAEDNPPFVIQDREKCGFGEVVKNHICFIVDLEPLIYIVLPETDHRIYLSTAGLISSVSLTFSKIIRELEKLKKALTKKEKEYEDFIHYVSHGLKSPLSSILGFSNLLATSLNTLTADDINIYSRKIATNSKLLNNMLEELVYLSRLKPEPERVDAAKILNSVLKNVSGDILEKNINVNILNKLPEVYMNKNHLKRILESVLRNCIDFCQPGSKVTINFQNGEMIISDNGPGIPESLLKKVDQPFISTKSKSDLSTGMGLFLVKKITETYGGSMRIESKYGYGTTIYIKLLLVEN